MNTTVIHFQSTTEGERTRISAIAGGVQRWAVVPAGHDHLVAVAITGLTNNYKTLVEHRGLQVAPNLKFVLENADAVREHHATMLAMLQLGNLAIEVDCPDRVVTDEERADAMRRAGWVTTDRLTGSVDSV